MYGALEPFLYNSDIFVHNLNGIAFKLSSGIKADPRPKITGDPYIYISH